MRDDAKCGGICWTDPANAELKKVNGEYWAKFWEVHG